MFLPKDLRRIDSAVERPLTFLKETAHRAPLIEKAERTCQKPQRPTEPLPRRGLIFSKRPFALWLLNGYLPGHLSRFTFTRTSSVLDAFLLLF